MGGTSSRTRRLTVDNDDQSCVIKVSDEVIKRLKQCEEEVRTTQVQQVVPFPALPTEQQQGFYFDPRLTTTVKSQQEKLQALKKNDEYWEKRMKDLENCHKEVHKIMEEEYSKTVAELSATEKKLYPCDSPPCQISKKKALDCYKEYSKQPLKCTKEVQAFCDCVDLQRSLLIGSKIQS
ncbi:hypothetical protein FQR65_LT07587 [Abscondita terminalis]|nr:hypothetical protein FQR65_LT07587 [Abscondita terminalis]